MSTIVETVEVMEDAQLCAVAGGFDVAKFLDSAYDIAYRIVPAVSPDLMRSRTPKPVQ